MNAATDGDAAAEPKRRRKEAIESVIAALDAGRDPKVAQNKQEFTLNRAEQTTLEGFSCGAGEERWYVLAAYEDVGRFLPASVKRRDPDAACLPLWDYVKVLPIEWYSIVYELKAMPGVYRAVPDAKLSLEGYPAASRSRKDAETAAGFATRTDLRLALRPQALRFFWLGLHEPMLETGAWPTTRVVWTHGYRLSHATRTALLAKLTPVPPAAAWLPAMRAALERRHWPAAEQPAAEAPAGVEPVHDPVAAAAEPVPAPPQHDQKARRAAAEARAAVATAAEERAAAAARVAAEATAAAEAAQGEATAARAAAMAQVTCAACGDVWDDDDDGWGVAGSLRLKCEPTAVLCGWCCHNGEQLPVCHSQGTHGERMLLCSDAAPFRSAQCTGRCFLVDCELDCAKHGYDVCVECIEVSLCSTETCTNLRTRCPCCPEFFDDEDRCEVCRDQQYLRGLDEDDREDHQDALQKRQASLRTQLTRAGFCEQASGEWCRGWEWGLGHVPSQCELHAIRAVRGRDWSHC
jgi:hypothetical protein